MIEGGLIVVKNKNVKPRRKSKRERRNKIIIYIMVIAMILSTLTAGLGSMLSLF